MKFTFYGHACFAVQIGGKNILFDPFITPNPLAHAIDVEKVPADFILVTHGHDDHVADLEKVAKRTKATVIAPVEVGRWFDKKGVANVQTLNHGGSFDLGVGRAKLTPAAHSSSMPDGSYGGEPCGFTITSDEGNFYNAGDTGLHYDMKLIADEMKLDFAVLPIGDHFTMGIDDALRSADFVGAQRIVAVHFDTFPTIKVDHEKVRAAAKKAGKEIILPKIGETLDL
ncbi:MAG TPA: metal-dependent hydrolase [Chthoniobacterales bacterium]|jgi:L-ascorbate metabolism protein UlaG (beta-lactamase superfamily)